VTSYLMYAGVAMLVYRLARRLLPRNAALAISLLFAVHPVHVEAVAVAVAQGELAVGLIAVATTLWYVTWRGRNGAAEGRARGSLTRPQWAALASAYALACLFKETGFVIPAFWLGAEMIVVPRGETPRPMRNLLGGAAMVAVAGAAMFALRWTVLRHVGSLPAPALADAGAGQRALTMLGIVPEWLRLLEEVRCFLDDENEPRLRVAPARREQRDGIALLAAERDQAERHLAHDLAHLPPRERVPRTVALEHLRRTVGALVDPAPEQSGQRVFGHTLTLPGRRRPGRCRKSAISQGLRTLAPRG